MPKNYLTPEGFTKLKSELQQLLDVERPKTTRAVAVAAAMGDRSENADYIYGKRRLREIDRRVRFLQQRLEEVEIIDPAHVQTHKVSFGLWVTLEDLNTGETRVIQLVGPDEIDPTQGRITFNSPLGKTLLGKSMGAEIQFQSPKGLQEYVIVAIKTSNSKL